MNKRQIVLDFDNRLILHKDAGGLWHSFGEGYFIDNEVGKGVNTFNEEAEFNRLIEKFRYREFLVQRLNESYTDEFKFGEDNMLIVNGEVIDNKYWNLPTSDEEVVLYFRMISDEIYGKAQDLQFSGK